MKKNLLILLAFGLLSTPYGSFSYPVASPTGKFQISVPSHAGESFKAVPYSVRVIAQRSDLTPQEYFDAISAALPKSSKHFQLFGSQWAQHKDEKGFPTDCIFGGIPLDAQGVTDLDAFVKLHDGQVILGEKLKFNKAMNIITSTHINFFKSSNQVLQVAFWALWGDDINPVSDWTEALGTAYSKGDKMSFKALLTDRVDSGMITNVMKVFDQSDKIFGSASIALLPTDFDYNNIEPAALGSIITGKK